MMQDFLSKMIGRKLDVFCAGSSSLRGEVVKVDDVLHLKDSDDRMCYVALDKIIVVWEALDEGHRAGFVPATLNQK